MDEGIKIQIDNLLNLLDDKLKELDIVEISMDSNNIIYEYLEKQGALNISYNYNNQKSFVTIVERSSNMDLVYKDINKNWVIDMYKIKKMLVTNWK